MNVEIIEETFYSTYFNHSFVLLFMCITDEVNKINFKNASIKLLTVLIEIDIIIYLLKKS